MWGKPINYQRIDEDYNQSVFLLDLQNFPEYEGVNLEKMHASLSILMVLISSCLIINVKSVEGLSSILHSLSRVPFKFEIKNQLKVFVLCRDQKDRSLNTNEIQNNMEKLFMEFSKKDSVVKLMENREYLFLPNPIDSNKCSINFDKGLEEVNPEFIIEVMKIRTKLFSNVEIHNLTSHCTFGGALFANYLQFFKNEMMLNNEGKCMNYKELFESFIKKENEAIFRDSFDLYELHIKEAIIEKLPLNFDDLQVN